MSTQLTQSQSILDQYTEDEKRVIKDSFGKTLNDTELLFFLTACSKYKLDPIRRQIHAVKRWDNKEKREVMAIQVGIDGFRTIASRTSEYAGNDDPVFDNENSPKIATVTVYRMVDGNRMPFTASARWDEYYPGEKQGFMWKKMPHVMLGKCAEALALRKAFPEALSGLHTDEEMQQAERVVTVSPDELIQSIEACETEIDLDNLATMLSSKMASLSPEEQRQVKACGKRKRESFTVQEGEVESAQEETEEEVTKPE